MEIHRDGASLPIATYRIQLTPDFGFTSLCSRIEYFRQLGISTLYLSPIVQARRGSLHGYDVVDPTRLNQELGTPEEFASLAASARAAGLDLLVDFVPNHMAASAQNPWWTDVLRHGPDSPYASYFDVDWSGGHVRDGLSDKVLLPILGRPYGDVLEDQEIRIAFDEGAFRVEYYDRRLPLNFTSYARILHGVRERLQRKGPEELIATLEQILITLNEWSRPEQGAQNMEEVAGLHRRLRTLAEGDPAFRQSLDHVLRILNGKKGEPESFDELDTILDGQSYRLAFWRNAAEEINYRRFFDISDLISIRVSDPEVFEATHELLLGLVEKREIGGIRLDHIDGLYDPARYLEMLHDRLEPLAPETLVVSEKILGENEDVPESFRYRGTTGYEFARALDRVFVDPEGLAKLEAAFASISDQPGSFASIARESKVRVLREMFRGELRAFTRRLANLAGSDRHAKDIPYSRLEAALVELIASFPVYRTYVRPEGVLERDFEILELTVRDAVTHIDDDTTLAALHFLHQVLRLDTEDESQKQEWLRFTMRLQQLTAPVTAKGVEDTALYVHVPLASLNEVGSQPVPPENCVAAFHSMNASRLSTTPKTLNTTSTHDTKRGEDTRCRLHVLSEMPEAWLDSFRLCRSRAGSDDEGPDAAPSEAEKWFFLQTLLGIWPTSEADWSALPDRLADYARKALREAKQHSRWTAIDEVWEEATIRWIRDLLEDERRIEELTPLHERIAFFGMLSSLAMTDLKIASPGIPDIYQGSEMWNLSLVDPDNRRPTDFEQLSMALSRIAGEPNLASEGQVQELRETWKGGRIKLWVTWRALLARRVDPELFLAGDYIPLEVRGSASRHLLAFARFREGRWAVAMAPIRTATLCGSLRFPIGRGIWGSTEIVLPDHAPRSWISSMTGRRIDTTGTIDVGATLDLFPVEILG